MLYKDVFFEGWSGFKLDEQSSYYAFMTYNKTFVESNLFEEKDQAVLLKNVAVLKIQTVS